MFAGRGETELEISRTPRAERALLQLLWSGSGRQTVAMRPRRLRPSPLTGSAFAGFCFPPEVIVLAVR